MKTFYVAPVTDNMITEKLQCESGEEILCFERVSSSHRKHLYEIRTETDAKYLHHAQKIIGDVGDFVRECLPGFPSRQRANFDYVRAHSLEFLDRYELLLTVNAETVKGSKRCCLSFDLPSFVSIPQILYRIKGHYLYLYNHLESRISFVIGDAENPKTRNYLIDDAMEEFWHLALSPYLLERLNKYLQSQAVPPSDRSVSRILVVEGELLSKAFAVASLDDFRKKKGYDIPMRKFRGKEKVIANRIKRVGGVRGALKGVTKFKGLQYLELGISNCRG